MNSNHFLADGFGRACDGVELQVRADVALEYAERLAVASFRQRLTLNREVRAEIKRRVAEELAIRQISPDALY